MLSMNRHFCGLRICALSAMFVSILSACGGATGTPIPTPTIEPVISSTATPVLVQQPPKPTATNASANNTPETVTVSDLGTNLSQLTSYRVRKSWSFEHVYDDSKIFRGALHTTQHIVDGITVYVRYENIGEMDGTGDYEIEMFRDGETIYTPSSNGDKTDCLVTTSDTATLDEKPNQESRWTFGTLENIRLVSPSENVNGLLTDRYSGVDTALNERFRTLPTRTGDVWIAQNGGYVVRYAGSASGSGTQVSPTGMSQITYTWSYDVTDINSNADINIPAECLTQKPADDLPILPGAQAQMKMNGVLLYVIPGTLNDARESMIAALTTAGWATPNATSTAEGVVTLTTGKDGRRLTVVLTKEVIGVSVTIRQEQ
jgi:hypothetical protein